MLNTSTIRHALQRHKDTNPIFHDVFPADLIPNPLPVGKACVVNTQPSHMGGEHWIVVIRKNASRNVHYFDSTGNTPRINLRGYKIIASEKQLQGTQPFCGHYCLIFVLALKKPRVLDLFEHRCSTNDLLVKLLAKREFGV